MSHLFSSRELVQLAVCGLAIPVGATAALGVLHLSPWGDVVSNVTNTFQSAPDSSLQAAWNTEQFDQWVNSTNGRPQLNPQPQTQTVWECEVVVVGGTLGGVAAASQSMQTGAKTCLIELTPWLGGQVSSQGVSAIDESVTMRKAQNFSQAWKSFKQLIRQQPVSLPSWTGLPSPVSAGSVNSCWVGDLCFPPTAGATASQQLLEMAAQSAPGSQWSTSTAFKGAEFDVTGQQIQAVYAVQRIPRNPNYRPLGMPSRELPSWYSWSSDEVFDKVSLRLQPPADKRMVVIDATDTGELIGWAGIPYRLGSESKAITGEIHASEKTNPDCTQAFTFPFALAIHDDQGTSLNALTQVRSDYAAHEHEKQFGMERFPVFDGGSLFHYRRIVSTTQNDPERGRPTPGDITLVNWNQGNDWTWMDPPLILDENKLEESGQRQNWMGGISLSALRNAENHAFLFSKWLIEHKSEPGLPLTHLFGEESPLKTVTGLSMMPYIREGRRILGRNAYGQDAFMIREQDVRKDLSGGRDLKATSIALTHYDIDIHGCRYRNGQPSWEAQSAPAKEWTVRPIYIPLEALIPQGVDNLLIGGKAIAVTHIVNGSTRVHYGEWSVGSAAGATAGWLVKTHPDLNPPDIIPNQLIPELQAQLTNRGLRYSW